MGDELVYGGEQAVDRAGQMRLTMAGTEDAQAIAALKAEGWRTTYAKWVPADVLDPFLDEERIAAGVAAALAEEPNLAVAAHTGDGMVGFALCLAAGRDDPFLDALHVLPARRGEGIGSAMIRRLARELASRGHGALTLAVVEQNRDARRLYERLGAVHVGSHAAPWAPDHLREEDYRWSDLGLLAAD